MFCRFNLTIYIFLLVRISVVVGRIQLITSQNNEPLQLRAPGNNRVLRNMLDASSDVAGSSRDFPNQTQEDTNVSSNSFSQIPVTLTKSLFIFNLPLTARESLTSTAVHSHLTQYLNENLKTSFLSSVTEGSYSFYKVDLSIELKDSIPNKRRYLSHGSRRTTEENSKNITNSTVSYVTAIMQGEAIFVSNEIPATSIMNDVLMKNLGPNSNLMNSFAKSSDNAISQIITYSYSIDRPQESDPTLQGKEVNGQPKSSSVEINKSNVPFIFIVSVICGALVVGIIVGVIILILRITKKKEVKEISRNDCDTSKGGRQESIAGLSVEESCGRSSAYFYDHRHISLLSPSMNDESLCSNRGAPPGASLNTYDDSFTKSLSLYDPRRVEMIVGISQKVAGGQSVGSGSRKKGPLNNK